MATQDYRVVDTWLDDDTPCVCGSCDWQGQAKDLADTEECILDPGDPSPAGRCPDPECGSLVYPSREQDRRFIMAAEMHTLLKGLIEEWPQFDADEDVNGADLVNYIAEFRAQAKNICKLIADGRL